MSKKLFFETSNTLFTRAQALVWIANGLSKLNLFEIRAGKLMSEIIEELPENKSLIINFNGIIRIDDHSLDEVYKSLQGNSKQIVITNGENLLEDFIRLKKDKKVNINHDASEKIIILGNSQPITFRKLEEEKQSHIGKYINSKLKLTFTEFNDFKRLCSTPFLANGEFNSKKIIESPNDFMWFSFYLSDKLTDIVKEEKLKNVVLVSASLRGSVFTSILGILNDFEYFNIDHVGPIHKVYDFNSLNINHREREYFYIGDFVFGGTEIKLTKVYTSFVGARLQHALVLGSLFESSVFKDFKLHELGTLRAISEKADYKLFD